MPDSFNVPVDVSSPVDYKNPNQGQPVSVKALRRLLGELEADLLSCTYRLNDIQRELMAIIEQIGEEW